MKPCNSRNSSRKTDFNLLRGCVLPFGWTPDNEVRLRGLKALAAYLNTEHLNT